MTIKLVSVTWLCISCNKPYDSLLEHPLGICHACETKYYFETIEKEFDFTLYTYANGEEVTMNNGIIKRINPTRTAILNNI